ncbi:MAG: DUF481 domain-containing protein [Burkholderiaceae bacterium]
MTKQNKTIPATILSLAALSAGAVHAQGVSITDYKGASSAYEDSYIYGDLNVYNRRADEQTGYDLNLSLDYDRVLSSPDRDIRFQGGVDGSVNRAGTAGASTQDSYTAGAGITVDTYFNPAVNNAFWYGSLSLDASSAYDNRQVLGTVGAGYGRVTNVTPMAKALRLLQELGERGQLTGPADLATHQTVAEIVEREAEYRSKYGADDYIEKWVQDIADAIAASGAAPQKLRAADVLKMADILRNERISTRKTGWKVRAGLGYVFRSFDGDSGSDPALEAGAEYHRALSNRTQFSNDARLTTILNDDDSSYKLRNVMSLTHEIDSRIDWENSWIFDYSKNGPTSTNATVNTVSSTFYYELANALDLSATLSVADYSGDETLGNPNGVDTAFFMGVRYRLK